jgi:hypothetical protein
MSSQTARQIETLALRRLIQKIKVGGQESMYLCNGPGTVGSFDLGFFRKRKKQLRSG